MTYAILFPVAIAMSLCLSWVHLLGKDRTMTPNNMLASVRELVPDAYIGNTGGNCGAIIVEDSRGYWHILVTTDSGPWATPADDDHDRGGHDWFVTLWDSDGSWVDGAGVRDGDTLTPAESVPHVVSAIVDSVSV